MAFRNTNSAESWDKIYQAFAQVNFTSFDFDTIKASLVDYLRIYYPETFNDLIQSSELIALLEMFAYIAEQLAYRVDMVSHENFITTAQRKASILRLAKLISYKATRNIPVRGLVKFTSVSTTERIIDSRGTDISNLVITWNDPNNVNWKEQFLLIMNRVLSSQFGQPQKSFEIGDVVMDLYSLKATTTSFNNGVFPFTASTGLDSYPMEVVPTDLDSNGPFEREPDLNSSMTMLYANDGIGDGSDYTGFLAYVKQGTLARIDYNIVEQLPNRLLTFLPNNVNATDVWVQHLDNTGAIAARWSQVDTVNEQNLIFNSDRSTRNKYEVDTLENDQISVLFGDGDFSDAPIGLFRFWMRQSANASIVVPKNKVVNQPLPFVYVSNAGNSETCTMTFSLTTTLQNGSASETIEHVRANAPSTYYSQNRMVNGQDYNTYMLKDPTILRLNTVNRTFAGQPKYIDWNDASGSYENVKLFGDDLSMRYELALDSQTTSLSGQALIDSVIEPLLNTSGIINALLHISATDPATVGVVSSPRRSFIEDNRAGLYHDKNDALVTLITGTTPDGSLKEKTAMQGLIDRHWYGEPLAFVQGTNSQVWALIPDPALFPKDDSRIYQATTPRTIDGVNKYPPGDIGSGLQPIAEQDYFALRYNRYMVGIGNGTISVTGTPPLYSTVTGETWTIEVGADGSTLNVRSSTRGTFPTGLVGNSYQITPTGVQTPTTFFTVTAGSTAFEPGDAFVVDISTTGVATVRSSAGFGAGYNASRVINLDGWWEILSSAQLPHYTGGNVVPGDEQLYTTDDSSVNTKQHSWLIFVHKIRQQPTNNVIGYEVHFRNMQLTVESPTTKFWFNAVDQILDSETQKPVYDNIKILRSNLTSAIPPALLGTSQIYDVVGAVKDSDGTIDFSKLEIVPTDLLQEDSSGNLVPDRLLQFESFSAGSYEYYQLSPYSDPPVILDPVTQGGVGGLWTLASSATYAAGAFVDSTLTYGRRPRMPSQLSTQADQGLDFMWTHFAPDTNIIDPSVSNIHDAYVITQGYYDSVISYVRGLSTSAPQAPTPLDLRNSYAYLLENKMLSDTVVLHPGKLRLLFGTLAEPQFRAKFKVIPAPGGSLTNERIKEELLSVINTYFDIGNWDFGETFYATELIALMHQRLPSDIASVLLVPIYSTNSFGDLFTVTCGFDEILQSAAQLSDIEIVTALTPTVIRQVQ